MLFRSERIPVTLVTDNMCGHLMQQGRVDMVIVGADRIAANGDAANKIGTYGVAVLAARHGIPFYVAAPLSTFDLRLADGSALAVVLGCSSSDTQVNLPTGPVNFEGVLQPSEDSDLMALSTDVPRLTTEGIVALLGSTVHDGYLVATPEHSDLSAVVPRLPGAVAVPLHWRNIVYVGNWLTFALITLAMWVRVARDEAESANPNQGVMNQ